MGGISEVYLSLYLSSSQSKKQGQLGNTLKQYRTGRYCQQSTLVGHRPDPGIPHIPSLLSSIAIVLYVVLFKSPGVGLTIF